VRELVVLRFKGKRDERGEAVRFVLQFAQAAQVVDPVRGGLDVAVEHRAGAPLAHLVPGAMDFEPFVGAFLAAANLVADLGIENFRAAAGERTQPRFAQNFERLADGLFRDPLGQVPDFDGGERLDGEIGAGGLQRPKHLRVIGEGQLRMESADDVDFGDALGLLRLAGHFLDVIGELAFRFVGTAGEGAELAAQDADVRVVEIEVEDVGRDVAVLPFADVIGQIAEGVEVLHRVEAQAFFVGQAPRGEDLSRDVGQAVAREDRIHEAHFGFVFQTPLKIRSYVQ